MSKTLTCTSTPKFYATALIMIICKYLIFYQIFLYKQGIYKLPHKLPSDLRLRLDLRLENCAGLCLVPNLAKLKIL